MATKDHPNNPEGFTSIVGCPTCEQKYSIQGLVMRDGQLMACSVCNTLFTVRVNGRKVETTVNVKYDGAPLGPAEGPQRH